VNVPVPYARLPSRGNVGGSYAFTGSIKGPRQVLKGGYLSWHDPVSDHWFQLTFFSGSKARVRDIGKLDAKASSFRVQVDRMTEQERMRVAGPKADSSSFAIRPFTFSFVNCRFCNLNVFPLSQSMNAEMLR
jgi:hypothetical protein